MGGLHYTTEHPSKLIEEVTLGTRLQQHINFDKASKLRHRLVLLPDLFDVPLSELQVVELTPHTGHHLTGVAAGQTDVLTPGVLPLLHKFLVITADQAHRLGGNLLKKYQAKVLLNIFIYSFISYRVCIF